MGESVRERVGRLIKEHAGEIPHDAASWYSSSLCKSLEDVTLVEAMATLRDDPPDDVRKVLMVFVVATLFVSTPSQHARLVPKMK